MKSSFLRKPEDTLLFSGRDILRLYIPLLIEQAFNMMVGLSDSIMVASCGEAALSSVSLVDMITNVLINVFAALATGGAVVTAQYIGAKENEKAKNTAWQLTIITFLFAFFISLAAFVFRQGILNFLFGKISDEVMHNALTYFTIVCFSYPMWGIYNSCAALFRAAGNSKISMRVSLIMNISNVAGNAILIYIFKMGVAGAAYSTLFARILATIIMLFLISDSNNIVYLDFKRFPRPDFETIRKILRIGVPNGFENSLFQLGKVLVISVVSVFGTAQIAANAAGSSISSVSIIPAQAMSLAMITVVGQCVGAKEFEQLIYYVKKLLLMACVMTMVLGFIIWLGLPLLMKIFNLSAEAQHIVTVLFTIHAILTPLFWITAFVLPNALRASNDVTYTMVAAVASMVFCRISLSYVFGIYFGMGVMGVWTAMFVDWIVRSICFVYRFAKGSWKKKCIKKAGMGL